MTDKPKHENFGKEMSSKNVNFFDLQVSKTKCNEFSCFTWTAKLQKKLNVALIRWFEKLGSVIARKWSYFVIIPFLLGCVCATGLQKVKVDSNYEQLLLPVRGRWSAERGAVEQLFGEKLFKLFDPTRLSTMGEYVNVIIKAKEKDRNILNPDIWNEIKRLDSRLMEETLNYEGTDFKFSDICASWKMACFSPLFPLHPSDLSRLGSLLAEIPDTLAIPELSSLKYTHFLNFTLQIILGKAEYDSHGILLSSKSINLAYWLRSDTPEHVGRARLWEKRVQEIVSDNNSTLIDVSYFSSRTPSDDMEIAATKMKPLLGLSVCLMMIFASICAIMRDSVRSKLILSFVGLLSVCLATASAFGILIYAGVPFISINLASVFLMLGIGIDDMFVILAAWRMTPLQESVEQRMISTYRHACVSVTITSATNVIAFIVGTLTSIRTIEIFSIYTSFSALLTYFFFITFFGGAMAAFGHLEKSQKHSVFCIKVKAKSQSQSRSAFYRLFMAGGIDASDPTNPMDNKPHSGMILVRDFLGAFLTNSFSKVGICVLYATYFGVAIFGISRLKQERHPDRVSFQELTLQYFDDHDFYYHNKPSFVQIVFTKPLNYSDPEIRSKILDLHDDLEELPFVNGNFTTSWIRDWYETIEENPSLRKAIESGQNIVKALRRVKSLSKDRRMNCHEMFGVMKNYTFEELFTPTGMKKIYTIIQDFSCSGKDFLLNFVPEDYLKKHLDAVKSLDVLFWVAHLITQANSIYELDVNFDSSLNHIESSRILIVVQNAGDEQVQETLRRIVDSSGIPGAQVFNYPAFIIEQVKVVKWTTIVSLLSTTAIVLLVALILIPNVACSLWVAFSIVSIEIGVIGFMVLWGVKLNSVSMVNLIMCIGFSVDFSAHISYAYLSSPGLNSKDWTKESMYSVGLPIILGGLSTMIAVIPGWFLNYVVFLTFFKIISLAIIFGLLHGLIFLPTFLAFFGPKNMKNYDLSRRWSYMETSVKERKAVFCMAESQINSNGVNLVNCDNCVKEKYPVYQTSDDVVWFTNNSKPLSYRNDTRKLCDSCRANLDNSILLKSKPNLVTQTNEDRPVSNSDCGLAFDVESITTYVDSVTDTGSVSVGAYSLATLDVKVLKESEESES